MCKWLDLICKAVVQNAAWDVKYSLSQSGHVKHKQTPHMQRCRQTCRHMCEV